MLFASTSFALTKKKKMKIKTQGNQQQTQQHPCFIYAMRSVWVCGTFYLTHTEISFFFIFSEQGRLGDYGKDTLAWSAVVWFTRLYALHSTYPYGTPYEISVFHSNIMGISGIP